MCIKHMYTSIEKYEYIYIYIYICTSTYFRFAVGGLRLAGCSQRVAVYGSRLTVCGSSFADQGSRFTVCDSPFTLFGSWFMACGFQNPQAANPQAANPRFLFEHCSLGAEAQLELWEIDGYSIAGRKYLCVSGKVIV